MTSTTAAIAGIIAFLIVVTVVLTKSNQSSLQRILRGEKPLKGTAWMLRSNGSRHQTGDPSATPYVAKSLETMMQLPTFRNLKVIRAR
jgi:hypothetical protein